MLNRVFAALALIVILAASAPAAPLTFVVDPSESFLQLSLRTQTGETFSSPQTPNSDMSRMFGSLQIDVTDTTLQFLTTSDIHFQNQNQLQAPLVDGSPGTSPAVFGLNVDLLGLASGVVSGRDYVADAVSAPIDRMPADVFYADGILFNITSGITSYNLTFLGDPVSGSTEMYNDAPNLAFAGLFGPYGNGYRLVLPITVYGETSIDDVSIVIAYEGALWAYYVPEPSGLMLSALGGIAALAIGYRRGKR